MRSGFFSLIALICVSTLAYAQSEHAPPKHELYGGYTYLSNSLNGFPGSRQSLNGWDASLAFEPWHSLRFKIDTYAYRGTNLGAPQQAWFILGGGQYGRRFGREGVFIEGLVGDAALNRDWGPQKQLGGTATFAALVGGGVDTPIGRRFAYRVTGGFQYAYASLLGPGPAFIPYRPAGLPAYFGRISTGVVWKF